MICKAGHITKRAVGSIKILDTESQFEIAGDSADSFWAAVKENGTGEKGVTIQKLDGRPARPARSDESSPSWKNEKKAKFKPKNAGGAPGEPPRKPFKKRAKLKT